MGKLFLNLLYLGIGLVFVAFSIYLASNRLSLVENSVRVQGIVIDKVWKCGVDSSSCTYFPVISYLDGDGVEHTFVSESGESYTTIFIPFGNKGMNDRSGSVKGKTLFVRYDRTNPEKAVVDSFLYIWGPVIAVGVLGMISVVVWYHKIRTS